VTAILFSISKRIPEKNALNFVISSFLLSVHARALQRKGGFLTIMKNLEQKLREENCGKYTRKQSMGRKAMAELGCPCGTGYCSKPGNQMEKVLESCTVTNSMCSTAVWGFRRNRAIVYKLIFNLLISWLMKS
jgi:hypothetical protein